MYVYVGTLGAAYNQFLLHFSINRANNYTKQKLNLTIKNNNNDIF